jgi:hypothetical protein
MRGEALIGRAVVEGSWLVRPLLTHRWQAAREDTDPSEPARHVTSIARLPGPLVEALAPVIMALASIGPDVYVYPAGSLHVTLLEATRSERSLDDLRADVAWAARALGRPPIAISVRGLAVGPGSLVAVLDDESGRFLATRRVLRERWGLTSGGASSGLASRVLHATLARWSDPPSAQRLAPIRRLHGITSRPAEVAAIELVSTNKVLAAERSTLLARHPLAMH